ncbi:MAG TPA: response regulator [Candidatus Polarisedimenticolia bacterium]|nr:response regulator [Candidatus Polarisedimenticolia bacterium]
MPKKILLADDSITIQKVVELTFSEGDYKVFSVGNGVQALKKAQEVRPDIALLDVIMPEANGYEVCEKLKRNPETSWIPVLLLTGTFEPFDRRRADAAGANGHLTKPFESQVLISKVEELITSTRHPLVEADRAGSMEIISGGGTYEVDAAQGPLPRQSSRPPEPSEAPEPELNQTTIVPDRFDDLEPVASPPPIPEVEGAQRMWTPSEPIPPPREAGGDREEREVATEDLVSEPWDELASGLATPPSMPEVEMKESRPFDFRPPAERNYLAPASPQPARHPSPADPPPPLTSQAGTSNLVAPPDPPSLSPEELERVVSLVVGQISDRVIREIAWEVIPELAESLIKKRIHELEEKVSREG